MQQVREGLRQRNGHRFHQVGLHVVAGLLLAAGQLQHALAAGHGEQRGVIFFSAGERRREIRQAEFLTAGLARKIKGGQPLSGGVVKIYFVARAVDREELVNAARFQQALFQDLFFQAGQQFRGLARFFFLAFLQLQEPQVKKPFIHVLEQLAQRLLAGEMPAQVRRHRDIVGREPGHYLPPPALRT